MLLRLRLFLQFFFYLQDSRVDSPTAVDDQGEALLVLVIERLEIALQVTLDCIGDVEAPSQFFEFARTGDTVHEVVILFVELSLSFRIVLRGRMESAKVEIGSARGDLLHSMSAATLSPF